MDTNTRFSTFANIGTDCNLLAKNGIPDEMNFSVRTEHLGWYSGNGVFHRVRGNSTVIREDTLKAYGAVSDNYKAVDNSTALGSLQYIDGMEIKKYGETKTGMQYIIGQLPSTDILGDTFTPYLIYRNSFNGRYPIQVAICPLRIVCQNQFNIAFKTSQNMFTLRHTAKVSEKLEDAQITILKSAEYLAELKKQAEKYATIAVDNATTNRIIGELFPIKDTMTERQKQTITDKIAELRKCINCDDNMNFKGTMWGLINAYTDFITHEAPIRQTATAEENRFIAVTFNPLIMQKFLTIANSYALAA